MATKSKSRRGSKVRDLNPRKDAKGGRHHRGARGLSGSRHAVTLSTGNPQIGHPPQ